MHVLCNIKILLWFCRLLCGPRNGMPSLPCLPLRSPKWLHVPHLLFMPQWDLVPTTDIQLRLVVSQLNFQGSVLGIQLGHCPCHNSYIFKKSFVRNSLKYKSNLKWNIRSAPIWSWSTNFDELNVSFLFWKIIAFIFNTLLNFFKLCVCLVARCSFIMDHPPK